jgi:uncharacterized protein (TIGR00730 family)
MTLRPQPKPSKAYKDLDFLNSPDARTVRLLAEFIQPQTRFRQEHIRDTIVFFGSARIQPRTLALRRLRRARAEVDNIQHPNKALLKQFRDAQIGFDMSRYYEDAAELARLITEWTKTLTDGEHFIVCSGGGPGIMEAANKGAHEAGGKTIGMNISLPFEQFANPYITKGLSFEFHYFFMRKFWFVYLAKALVAFPGGFGTFDELMEVLTLLQTRKLKKKLAVVMYGSPYWNKVIDFEEMVNHGVISRDDLNLFTFLDTPEAAFQYLKKFLIREYIETRKKAPKGKLR